MTDTSDEDGPVGYRRPPKSGQFKKGQSGCPSGGHAQRRAKRAQAKKKQLAPSDIVLQWYTNKKKVKVNGRKREKTLLELALMQLEEDVFVKRDPQARKLFFELSVKNGWFKPPPAKIPGTGVLVVYPIMKEDEWAKETEGELLPRDPLHGIPGGEGILMDGPQKIDRKPPPE